jgi:hypothetical protein
MLFRFRVPGDWIAGGVLFVSCASGWLYFALSGDAARAWRALLINFLFFTPLASGMIVWPAIVVVSQGRWAKPLERTAFAPLAFAPISLAAFVALWLGHSHWAGWLRFPDFRHGIWFNSGFLFLRDFLGLSILWSLCAAFVIRRRHPIAPVLAGWLCLAYGLVFTLIAFDLVMALDPHWFSALFGGYFFVSGLYASLAAWTVVSIVSQTAAVELRHDLGKLIVAFSLLTGYLMYSQLLPIWYENLPAETRFVVPRMMQTPWRYFSIGLIATVYLGPLILLLTRGAKRSPSFLAFVSFIMVVGLWVERWWEVTPTLGGEVKFGFVEGSITLAFVTAFFLSVRKSMTRNRS